MRNVSVLDGNLFGCNLQESNLPENDGGKEEYECGSSSFNISGYVFSAVLVIFLCVTVYFYQRGPSSTCCVRVVDLHNKWSEALNWFQSNGNCTFILIRYQYVTGVYVSLLWSAFYCVVFTMLVVFPLCIVLTLYFGTHTNEYAWAASAGYLSGDVPFAIVLILMCMVQCVWVYRFREAVSTKVNLAQDSSQSKLLRSASHTQKLQKVLVYCAFFLANVVVVAGANVGYVYVIMYGQHEYLILTQVAMSVFKLLWGNVGSVYLVRYSQAYLAYLSHERSWQPQSLGLFSLQLFLALFSTIIIPAIVILLINPD